MKRMSAMNPIFYILAGTLRMDILSFLRYLSIPEGEPELGLETGLWHAQDTQRERGGAPKDKPGDVSPFRESRPGRGICASPVRGAKIAQEFRAQQWPRGTPLSL